MRQIGLIPDSSSRTPPAQELSVPILEFGLEEIPHISPRTYISLNGGEDLGAFTFVHTVDCRPTYEYTRAILLLINLTGCANMIDLYSHTQALTTAFVFLSENSSIRASRCGSRFPASDRLLHSDSSPSLIPTFTLLSVGSRLSWCKRRI
jgi:hypothetical protein